jgi:hypothetical protein
MKPNSLTQWPTPINVKFMELYTPPNGGSRNKQPSTHNTQDTPLAKSINLKTSDWDPCFR